MKNLVLASASPRRKEIFQKLGLDFSVCVSDKEPPTGRDDDAEASAFLSAKTKAEDVFSENKDSVVVGADTVVSCDNVLLGKPENRNDAEGMLRLLSGREHDVLTAVYVCSRDFSGGFISKTRVEFYKLSDAEIENYLNTDDWCDKAGGYGIQSKAIRFVKGICGDYNNVVGFPAAEFVRFLEKNIK